MFFFHRLFFFPPTSFRFTFYLLFPLLMNRMRVSRGCMRLLLVALVAFVCSSSCVMGYTADDIDMNTSPSYCMHLHLSSSFHKFFFVCSCLTLILRSFSRLFVSPSDLFFIRHFLSISCFNPQYPPRPKPKLTTTPFRMSVRSFSQAHLTKWNSMRSLNR